MKTKLFENAFQTGVIWKRRPCILLWTKIILKRKIIENDDVTTITWFSCQSFHQAQIQTNRWSSRFKFLQRSAACIRRAFNALSEWNLRFQFPLSALSKREDIFRLEPRSSFAGYTREVTVQLNTRRLNRFQGWLPILFSFIALFKQMKVLFLFCRWTTPLKQRKN